MTGIKSIAAKGCHTCVLMNSGIVKCQGQNYSGQIDVPKDLGRVKSVMVGYNHSCALKYNGQLECWGYKEPRDPILDGVIWHPKR